MSYIPKPDEKNKYFSFMLIFSGIIIWIFSSIVTAYRVSAQFISIAVIAFGVQFLLRYVLTGFKYILTDDGYGGSYFIILKFQGNKSVKVCDVPLGNAVAAFKLAEVSDYAEKYGKALKRFNYCQNPGKKLAYSLLFYDGENLIEIRFEPDNGFAHELLRRVNLNLSEV